MNDKDPRLVERGVTRARVIQDLKRVVDLCGGIAEAADAMEISRSMIATGLNDYPSNRVAAGILEGLYGPAGCELPEDWRSPPEAIGSGPVLVEVAADGRSLQLIEATPDVVEAPPAAHCDRTSFEAMIAGSEIVVAPPAAEPARPFLASVDTELAAIEARRAKLLQLRALVEELGL